MRFTLHSCGERAQQVVESERREGSSTMDWGVEWMLKTVMNGGFGAFGLWKTRIKSGENDGCKVLA
jgi:hypothetical protein